MSVKVKICGLTNTADASAALDLGADYLGFVLYRRSPRMITVAGLARILERLKGRRRAIGVFVNERRSNVEKIVADCGLYAVQIHGDEDAGEFSDFPVPVWRAVRFVSGSWKPLPSAWKAERYLIDSSISGMYGGTGVVGDWKAAGKFARKWPAMLSGGLTPDNVAEAIRMVDLIGVDAASGVESRPGKKDIKKLKAFFRNVKAGGR